MPFLKREQAALDILRNPERFTGLPRRRDADRLLCIWRAPSFASHASWSLFREDDRYIVRRLEHDHARGLPINTDDPHIYGAEALLSASQGRALLDRFETLHLPPFRCTQKPGLDGTYYGVRYGGTAQGVDLRWWEHPAEWEALDTLCAEAADQMDLALPTSTLRAAPR